jgi:short-subunit dehydrogenase
VQVTTVHPGGIKTNIANNAAAVDGTDADQLAKDFNAKLARTTPEKAAEVILAGVEKNKARVLIGADAIALDAMTRVLGARYQSVVTFFAKRTGM